MNREDRRALGSVRYHVAGKGYFEQRGLRRTAGAWSLWALGVGAVVSGDFFGWNLGLAAGGFGGLVIATAIVAAMYLCLCVSLAELSAALPHSGGAYSFCRAAMGPWAGLVAGLAATLVYVLTPAVIAVAIGGYLGAIFDDLFGVGIAGPVWSLLAYALFVGLNLWSVELAFKVAVVAAFVALAILAIFWVGAVPYFSWDHALDIPPSDGNGLWLPFGWSGAAAALPFAIWFFLAIELLPLAAEETHDPKQDLPKGLLYGILTLIVAALLTLLLSAGVAPGAEAVGNARAPLSLAFRTVFGEGIGVTLPALIALAGLIASFHCLIYAYGRNIYALSRAGYFPHWLSLTHATRKTPQSALVAGALPGYLLALAISLGRSLFGLPIGAALLEMAVLGATISYLLQMLSFVLLRRKLPEIERPYVSPLGNAGACLAGAIALTVLVTLLAKSNPLAVVGCALWFAAGLTYFALHGRKTLVYAPEEAFAVKHLSAQEPKKTLDAALP
ncbi:MAG: amino acid permease [Kiloniellales bacterium]